MSSFPLFRIVDMAANKVNSNKKNCVSQESEILRQFFLSFNCLTILPMAVKLEEVFFPELPSAVGVDTVIPFVVSRNDKNSRTGFLQDSRKLHIYRFIAGRVAVLNVTQVD